jgi:CheY-like chemotaxis protein
MGHSDHAAAGSEAAGSRVAVGGLQVVIVDSTLTHYDDFIEAARAGQIGLHLCVDGRAAVRLARRFRSDAWLIAAHLDDISGFDLLEMLTPHVLQAGVDPLRSGSRVSLEQAGTIAHSGLFIVADDYVMADEQRALVSGVAGYLVRPVTLDVIQAARGSRRHVTESAIGMNRTTSCS